LTALVKVCAFETAEASNVENYRTQVCSDRWRWDNDAGYFVIKLRVHVASGDVACASTQKWKGY